MHFSKSVVKYRIPILILTAILMVPSIIGMARGAVISMLLVIFVLPAMFMLMDKLICKTTLDMRQIKFENKVKEGETYNG